MMEVYGDLLEQRYAEDPDQTFAKFAAQFASGSTDDRIRRLLAGENVNTFLIVTFTEAAAAEMKERLEGAIRGALAESEGEQRQHLLKQLRLLNVANISTLHEY
ncbi:UvrD-helicase domain-containing protein [Weissella confusa]|uniref:UvrD-helicase domain-containing protein n=1 Tax=Weissella confusa TaxID=1583 RepID=A0A923ND47_WEICO|nr:UvrD-helicase domain-containing protein [Weissella confusa]